MRQQAEIAVCSQFTSLYFNLLQTTHVVKNFVCGNEKTKIVFVILNTVQSVLYTRPLKDLTLKILQEVRHCLLCGFFPYKVVKTHNNNTIHVFPGNEK